MKSVVETPDKGGEEGPEQSRAATPGGSYRCFYPGNPGPTKPKAMSDTKNDPVFAAVTNKVLNGRPFSPAFKKAMTPKKQVSRRTGTTSSAYSSASTQRSGRR